MSHDVANGSRALSVCRRLVVRSLRSHRRLARAMATGAGLGAALLASHGYAQQYGMPRPMMPAQAPMYAPPAGMAPYGAPAPAWRLVPVQVDAQGVVRPVIHAMPVNGTAAPGWCMPPCAPGTRIPTPAQAPGQSPDAAQAPVEGEAPQAAGESTTPSAEQPAAEAPSTQPADVTSQSAADQANIDSLSSATGGAESASSGAPNMVGDFIFPGGQIAVTPLPQIVLQQVPVVIPNLQFQTFPPGTNGFPSDRFVSPSNPNLSFQVAPNGLITGQPGVVDSWQVTGGPSSGFANQQGTAFLTAIDNQTGTYVADVVVIQNQTVLIQPSTQFIDASFLALNRFKVTENNHPLPNDRVFFNYNWYQNALQTSGAIGARSDLDIHQFTFGVERTVLNGWGSVELRVPFSSTINSTQFLDHSQDAENVELGDVRLILKALLYNDGQVAAAVGAAVSTPTSDDVHIFQNSGDTNPLLTLHTEAFHVIPYVTVLARPCCSRLSVQGWAQVDFDASGNDIEVLQGGNASSGELRDQTLLYMDGAVAYDFWDSGCYPGRGGLTRIVPAAELHWTSTLEDAEFFHQGNVVIGNFRNQINIVNTTLAAHFIFGGHGHITPAYVFPLSNGEDKVMDGEFALQTQWNY